MIHPATNFPINDKQELLPMRPIPRDNKDFVGQRIFVSICMSCESKGIVIDRR